LGWLAIMAICGFCQLNAAEVFVIQVLDDATGRGVPLVQLRTVNKIVYWTDSNGIIAFDEPGLMDKEVYFHVESPGYEMPADGFGYRGVKLTTKTGKKAEIRLKRINIAERLYRVTGQGIYRDSVIAGIKPPLQKPLIDGLVMGQDTVIVTPYRGKLYWFWGDTDKISYPLGHFGAAGATSELPSNGGLNPSVGINLKYFVDSTGFSKPTCVEPNTGLHWIQALFTVPDKNGKERLLARVAIHKDIHSVLEWRLLEFNDEKEQFETIQRWDLHDHHESAHPFRASVHGTNYFFLFPDYRIPATYEGFKNLGDYEAFTCLKGDGKWQNSETQVDRNADHSLRYSWKKGADCHHNLSALIKANQLKPEETWSCLLDIDSGKPLTHPFSTVAWNEYRHRWIAFFPDQPGEVWFAEADTPLGPWGYAKRIVTHGNYNFYNIAHHDFFNQDGGQIVYFEGTYTATFSSAKMETPRYDYNQLMYRMALDDKRLELPIAIYAVETKPGQTKYLTRDAIFTQGLQDRATNAVWFALPPEAHTSNGIPVYIDSTGNRLSTHPQLSEKPQFLGLKLDQTNCPTTKVLWRYHKSQGGEVYSIETTAPKDCATAGEPICRVWRPAGVTTFVDWKIKPVNTSTPPQN